MTIQNVLNKYKLSYMKIIVILILIIIIYYLNNKTKRELFGSIFLGLILDAAGVDSPFSLKDHRPSMTYRYTAKPTEINPDFNITDIPTYTGLCLTKNNNTPKQITQLNGASYFKCRSSCAIDPKCSAYSYGIQFKNNISYNNIPRDCIIRDNNNKSAYVDLSCKLNINPISREASSICKLYEESPNNPVKNGDGNRAWGCYDYKASIIPTDEATYNGNCVTSEDKYPPWKHLGLRSYEKCRRSCASENDAIFNKNDCAAYSYSDKGECLLYDVKDKPYAKEQSDKKALPGTAPSGTLITKGDDNKSYKCYVIAPSIIPKDNETYNGDCRTIDNGLPPSKSLSYTSYDTCKNSCITDPKCTAYNYSTRSGNCILYDISNNITGSLPGVGTESSGTPIRKGYSYPGNQLTKCYVNQKNNNKNFDFYSSDPKTYSGACRTSDNKWPSWKSLQNTTYQNCKNKCNTDTNCTAYGYSTDGKGNCQIFTTTPGTGTERLQSGTALKKNTTITKGNGDSSWKCYKK